jgi:hypothetical protein
MFDTCLGCAYLKARCVPAGTTPPLIANECHRYPPTAMMASAGGGSMLISRYPPAVDGCGEYLAEDVAMAEAGVLDLGSDAGVAIATTAT